MICPSCSGKTRIMETRTDNTGTYRRHRCVACGFLFYTSEQVLDDNKCKLKIAHIVNGSYKNY